MAFLATSVKDFYKRLMIVSCPFCQTKFLIQASQFAVGARQMKCAKCKHGWRMEDPNGSSEQKPESEDVFLIEKDKPAVEEAAVRQHFEPLVGEKTLKMIKTAFAVVGLIFVFWLIFNRQNIVLKLGFLEPVYDAIGLHIYHTGEGLNINAVRSELVYEDGIMKLVVEGKIKNVSSKTLEIPALKASAVASDGHILQGWQIDASTAKIQAGEEIPFRSSINAPRETVVDINLNFVEKKSDVAE